MNASPDEGGSQQPDIRIRINAIDHIMAEPGPLDDPGNAQGIVARRVPVVRIFGTTSGGERACLHVHQVFPYFYISYEGSLNPEAVNRYISRLHHALNSAIAISLNRNHQNALGQFVRAIVLVKGIHFYGFHVGYSPFLKIMLTIPDQISRAILILQSGSVMGRKMNVFEAHLSYPLQFMCDFNLYGCDWVDLRDVHYRTPRNSDDIEQPLYHPTTSMPLEFDVASYNILNRHRVSARHLHHELQVPAPETPEEHLVSSVRELWEDEKRRRIAKGLTPSPEIPSFNPSDRMFGGEWAMEPILTAELQNKIRLDCDQEPPAKSQTWEQWVMTTFESVQALWDKPHKTWRPAGERIGTSTTQNPFDRTEAQDFKQETHGEVDTKLLRSQSFEAPNLEQGDEISWEQWHHEQEAPIDPVIDDPEYGPPPEMHWETSGPLPHLSAVKNSDLMLLAQPGIDAVSPEGSDEDRSRTPTPTPRGQNDNCTRSLLEKRTSNSTITTAQVMKNKSEMVTNTVVPDPANATDDSQSTPTQMPRKLPLAGNEVSGVLRGDIASSVSSKKGAEHWPITRTLKSSKTALEYSPLPPTSQFLLSRLAPLGIPQQEYRDPYYSRAEDVPDSAKEYGGLQFHLRGDDLPEWLDADDEGKSIVRVPIEPAVRSGWEYAGAPPSRRETKRWLIQERMKDPPDKRKWQSQLEGATQRGSFVGRLKPTASKMSEFQSLSMLSLELFVATDRSAYDPEEHEIAAISWCFYDGGVQEGDHDRRASYESGVLAARNSNFNPARLRDLKYTVYEDEADLINSMIDEVRSLDPDVLCGWEVQANSWGYFMARAQSYGVDVRELLGRAPRKRSGGNVDNWSTRHTSSLKIAGRHIINTWRVMRSELNLNFYTLHNVARHVLKQRVPRYTNATLNQWFSEGTPAEASRVLSYIADLASIVLEILDETQFVTKTSEFARVFGIDFFSVISRGSQFKVESFMLRIAKPESFVLISPSRAQVGKQNGAECMPLIMEPASAFYKSPLLVLDFQSLYPSVMVAYNYCYSTCLGRIKDFKGQNKFGVLDDLEIPAGTLEKLKDHLTIAPNGMIYVKPSVRKSLLAKMLTELLDTRVMVKQGMKLAGNNKALLRVLDARQLSLKFICNVTYGYTSASFSGRMPAVEVADSIVQSGRETLEKAIHLIESTSKWGAHVVYGDTDSLFVYLPGKTKEQAFVIGNQIANAVTASNPSPVKLKFEKVYLPSVLLAKKRYVGFKYEDPDEIQPEFDAKGIETVRRDGIPAGQKMVETSLKILFRTQDLSEVKAYCWRNWTRILEGRFSIQDFIFAKEVRMGTYSDKVAPQPGAAIAAARMAEDPNDEVQYGERVRFVITRAAPGQRLSDRCVAPEELLFDETGMQLDTQYYVANRLIPPLARIFNLVGVDVQGWFDEMPKPQKMEGQPKQAYDIDTPFKYTGGRKGPKVQKIESHFASNLCMVCENITNEDVCPTCLAAPESTIYELKSRLHTAEQKRNECQIVCASCSGVAPADPIRCESLECEWLYSRVKYSKEVQKLAVIEQVIDEISKKSM